VSNFVGDPMTFQDNEESPVDQDSRSGILPPARPSPVAPDLEYEVVWSASLQREGKAEPLSRYRGGSSLSSRRAPLLEWPTGK
jgi:hypothetical protein